MAASAAPASTSPASAGGRNPPSRRRPAVMCTCTSGEARSSAARVFDVLEQEVVGGQRQELHEPVGERHLVEQAPRVLRPPLPLEPVVVADLTPDPLELLGLDLPHELGLDRPPVRERRAV